MGIVGPTSAVLYKAAGPSPSLSHSWLSTRRRHTYRALPRSLATAAGSPAPLIPEDLDVGHVPGELHCDVIDEIRVVIGSGG